MGHDTGTQGIFEAAYEPAGGDCRGSTGAGDDHAGSSLQYRLELRIMPGLGRSSDHARREASVNHA